MRLVRGVVTTGACLAMAVATAACAGSATVSTTIGADGSSVGAGGSGELVGPLASHTPLPTRTRPPVPAVDEQLEAHEGPVQPVAPRKLGTGPVPAPVIYTYKVIGRSGATRFAQVKSTAARPVSVTYLRAFRGSTAVADVAVYQFAEARATDPIFQAQVVGQLVQQASHARVVSREQVIGRPLAFAGGAQPAAAWFSDDAAVLVLGPRGAAGLGAVRAVTYSYALNPHPS